MKANRLFPGYGPLFVLFIFLLSATVGKAQTFTGQRALTELPASFEAVIYPLTNRPTTVQVIFNNPTGGSVQVVIRNQDGKVFYDESEVIAHYRRCFDLSSLPDGNYTVELSKPAETFTQAFSIKPPVTIQSQIALSNQPFQKKFEKRTDKKLIVSQ